mmetsp:Transcript_36089/g.102165  ORF Transcript_36089/g.102165 Transcript_36089/m.102165 type:complete len:408 (-) Transcript_36089:114-1337(-)
MALRFAVRTVLGAGAVAAGAVTAKAASCDWDWSRLHFDAVSESGPLVRAVLDAETSHALGILSAKMGLFPVDKRPYPKSLQTEVWGKKFPNPLGVAAGFDKDAEVIAPLFKLGFGFVEIGSVTPLPQPGNPKPRIFRLPELKSVINRCGFNSKGADVAAENLKSFAASRDQLPEGLSGVLGVNLGKNKATEDAAADYEIGIAKLGEFGDYIVINVSSPNTPGLRTLQGRKELEALIRRVQEQQGKQPWAPPNSGKTVGSTPILVKIAPDLEDRDRQDIAEVCLKLHVDGLIVSNTTLQRPGEVAQHPVGGEAGGLSGCAMMDLSTEVLRDMYSRTKGRLPIVGVGGVASGEDAYRKIRAGASLVQIYSSFAYQGPAVVPRIKTELAACLARDGFASISDAVGADHRK